MRSDSPQNRDLTLRGKPAVLAGNKLRFCAGLITGLILTVSVGRLWASAANGLALQISDIFGLQNELAIRVSMGVGYTANRALMVGPSGLLESVAGDLSHCVRVDGTSGPCDPTFVDGETPAGTVNGSNPSFSLSRAPNPASSLHLFRNGLRMKVGVDYSLSGANVTFLAGAIPQVNDLLIADYIAPEEGGPP